MPQLEGQSEFSYMRGTRRSNSWALWDTENDQSEPKLWVIRENETCESELKLGAQFWATKSEARCKESQIMKLCKT